MNKEYQPKIRAILFLLRTVTRTYNELYIVCRIAQCRYLFLRETGAP